MTGHELILVIYMTVTFDVLQPLVTYMTRSTFFDHSKYPVTPTAMFNEAFQIVQVPPGTQHHTLLNALEPPVAVLEHGIQFAEENSRYLVRAAPDEIVDQQLRAETSCHIYDSAPAVPRQGLARRRFISKKWGQTCFMSPTTAG